MEKNIHMKAWGNERKCLEKYVCIEVQMKERKKNRLRAKWEHKDQRLKFHIRNKQMENR